MKTFIMAETKNVIAGNRTLSYLQNRPTSELVGLGLIYGSPGLGKSRFARRVAANTGQIWMSLRSSGTNRSFLYDLFAALTHKLGLINERPRSKTSEIFDQVIEMISDLPRANSTVFLDEIDYAFGDKKLLGTIRDIVDNTIAQVVMVGMKDAQEKLLKANSHYFDRCNSFCLFQPLDREDTALVVDQVAEVKVNADLVEYINKATHGNLRQTMKLLYIVESIAKLRKIDQIGLKDTGELRVD